MILLVEKKKKTMTFLKVSTRTPMLYCMGVRAGQIEKLDSEKNGDGCFTAMCQKTRPINPKGISVPQFFSKCALHMMLQTPGTH